MEIEKEDRRIVYTKRVLKEGLLELMKNRPINKITVTAICRKADINRNTFYTHFGSPVDLLSTIEESFSIQIINTIKNSVDDGVNQDVLCKICQHIKDNGDLCKILFSDYGNGDYLQRMISILFEISIGKLRNQSNEIDESRLNWLYLFISSGSAAVIKEWVKKGMKESPSEIAMFIETSLKAVEKAYG